MARASMAKTHPAASNGLAPSTAPGQPNAEPWLGEKERFMLLLIAPAGIVLALFQIVPIIFGANASFRDWQLFNPTQTWVGLKHYLYILNDPTFLTVVLPNTFLLMFLSVMLSLIGGLAL